MGYPDIGDDGFDTNKISRDLSYPLVNVSDPLPNLPASTTREAAAAAAAA